MQYTSDNKLLEHFNWRKYLFTVFAVWSILSILICLRWGAFRISQGQDAQWLHISIYTYVSALLWVLFSPLLPLIVQRVFTIFQNWVILVLVHLLIALVLTSLHSCLFLAIDYYVRHLLELPTAQANVQIYISTYFSGLLLDGLVTYGVFIGLLIGYLLYLRNKEMVKNQTQLEKHLMQSRIKNLHYQLQPHFLFNSMQTISNLMHKDVNIADKAILSLSDILRSSIQQLDTDSVTIQEEVSTTKKYLDFQKLRFEENINYSIDVKPEVYLYQIPSLLLQPLVENSIKHGFEKTGQPVNISIQIRARNNRILFDVIDNGSGIQETDLLKNNSTGISNLKNRLNYFYHEAYTFKVSQPLTGGSHIHIEIPTQYDQK